MRLLAVLAVAAALLALPSVQGDSLQEALAFVKKTGQTKYNKDLLELAAIPTISAQPAHDADIVKAANWLIKRLTAAGLENAKLLYDSSGKGRHPTVYAEWLHAEGAPTALLYAHYDVQPADPLELWETPPFEPQIRGSGASAYFAGRGVADDKGQGVVLAIQSVEAYLKSSGSLPINVKVFFEGQEEVGSPDLPAILKAHKKLLKSDFVISADGGQVSPDQGGLTIGLRGATAFEVEAVTLSTDVHSGSFGGSIVNSNWALAHFLTTLHTPTNAVNITGFYDAVQPTTPEDESDMAAFPYNEQQVRASIGATAAHGEEGYSTLARLWTRGTCEIIGMAGGYYGDGVKTIVPARALAKVVCRLVPNQDPDAILEAAKAKVEAATVVGTRFEFRKLGFSGKPYLMARDSPVNNAAAAVLEELYGKPVLYERMGGSIPATGYFRDILGIETTCFAFGLSTNRVHAPNENYPLKQYTNGLQAWVRLLPELAKQWQAGGKQPHAKAAATEQDSEL